MRLLDISKFSLLKNFRNKKNIYFILILTLCSIILLASLSFRNLYMKGLEEDYEKNIAYRRLIVMPNQEELLEHYDDKTYDYGFEKILDINYVENMYNLSYDFFDVQSPTFKNSKYDIVIELLYGDEVNLPKNVIGENIKSNDTGVAICAKKFYPTMSDNSMEISDSDYLDGEKMIGTSFIIKEDIYNRINGKLKKNGVYEKEYKIIGVFDTRETQELHNSCYISAKDMRELYDTTSLDVNPDANMIKLVTVESKKNLKQVSEDIINMGFRVETQVSMDYELMKNIKLICLMLCLVSVIAIVVLTIAYTKKKNFNDLYEIGLLKALGYKNKDIILLNILKIFWFSIIAIILSIIIIEVLIFSLKIYFNNYLIYNNLIIKHYLNPYVISLFIILILPLLVNLIYINKLVKNTSINLLKGEQR